MGALRAAGRQVRVERTREIAASPERVYDVVMDASRLGEWVTIHAYVSDAPEGQLVEGSRLKQGFRLAGLPFDVQWEVVRAERPALARWLGAGPLGSRAEVLYDLAPAAGGGRTRFHYVNAFELPGGALTLGVRPMIVAQAGREVDATLRRLAALLERPGDS